MKLLSILALLLAVSCSSKSTTCKADTDCSGTQVCNATTGACIAQTATNCRTDAICPSTAQYCNSGICSKFNPANRYIFTSKNQTLPGAEAKLVAAGNGNLSQNGKVYWAFNSAANADAVCGYFAATAGLPGKWASVLADFSNGTGTSAFDRIKSKIANDTQPIYTLNTGATKIADTWAAMNTVTLAENALMYTEIGDQNFVDNSKYQWSWAGANGLSTAPANAAAICGSTVGWDTTTTTNTTLATTSAGGQQGAWFGNLNQQACNGQTTSLLCIQVD